ncbi:hypothetical protein NC652_037867 [Populus alba x Populus x berolinensis]|uniref:Uncharacterized protein n=1 Tax=Populus alba x Populus x berolinensis TaxID=444605 RepID=A0AAD6LF40_9ROSI|nr:hypothetical protein NC652_037867 [Populus alba x Populus x berolinensis]KAJ6959551.1 hypothetical protein NC653_037791 [Populus alba x Populus x berolinensis]
MQVMCSSSSHVLAGGAPCYLIQCSFRSFRR